MKENFLRDGTCDVPGLILAAKFKEKKKKRRSKSEIKSEE